MAVQSFINGGTLSSTPGQFSHNAQQPCTIMAWIRANDAAFWNQRVSCAGIYGPPALSAPSSTPVTAMQLGCYNFSNFACWTWGGLALVASGTFSSPPVGVWTHYAVSYNGTTYTLYINGVFNAANTVSQQAGSLNQTYINGYPTGGTNETNNFAVDDFIFFSRSLSQDEIRTIYHLEGPRDGIVQNCHARYTYEEGVVGTAVVAGIDLSPSKAVMTPAPGTPALYYPSRAMTNLRLVQG